MAFLNIGESFDDRNIQAVLEREIKNLRRRSIDRTPVIDIMRSLKEITCWEFHLLNRSIHRIIKNFLHNVIKILLGSETKMDTSSFDNIAVYKNISTCHQPYYYKLYQIQGAACSVLKDVLDQYVKTKSIPGYVLKKSELEATLSDPVVLGILHCDEMIILQGITDRPYTNVIIDKPSSSRKDGKQMIREKKQSSIKKPLLQDYN